MTYLPHTTWFITPRPPPCGLIFEARYLHSKKRLSAKNDGVRKIYDSLELQYPQLLCRLVLAPLPHMIVEWSSRENV